jgi:hypothetical protein
MTPEQAQKTADKPIRLIDGMVERVDSKYYAKD